jgi:SP family myo-inositol transporter-like MFS transporter 13
MYFSATIFAMVGFQNPTATALLIALTNFFLTLVAFAAIDYIGRRRILLISIPFMGIGLLISALAFAYVNIPHSITVTDIVDAHTSQVWSGVLLASFLLFVAAYALGIGNVPWQQAELFPLSVRALGSALATSTNWTSNFVVGITFLPMMEALTPSVTMAIYAAICALTWIAIYRIYPETKGLSLEQVTRVLAE